MVSQLVRDYAEEKGCSLQKAAAEMRQIKQLELVSSVKLERGRLIIRTHSLYCRGVNIGKYTISFRMVGPRRLMVKNDQPVGGPGRRVYQHEFFWGSSGSSFCLGTAGSTLARLKSRKEFPAMVSILIEFLQATAGQDRGDAGSRAGTRGAEAWKRERNV